MLSVEKYDIAPYVDTSAVDGSLRCHAYIDYTKAHGPDERFSIWLQGCLKRCPGCSNQQMLDIDNPAAETEWITPEKLFQMINDARKSVLGIKGLTLQGGVPLIQARNLLLLLEMIRREIPDFHILLFTGYLKSTLNQMQSPDINQVLSLVDTVIDGPFEASQRDNELIRGSTNQRIYHESDNSSTKNYRRHGRETSINPAQMTATSTGIRIK